jgi:opacity protein-like surface antigen
MIMIFVGIGAAQEVKKSDISLNYTGVFSKQSNGSSITVNPTQASGFLTSYRYSFATNSAVELNYGYSRNTQQFINGSNTSLINTNVHEWTADYVYKFSTSKIQPFVLAGTGVLVFGPTNSGKAALSGVGRQGKPVLLYGGGLDYNVSKAVSLRAQYRGLLYKTPDFGVSTLNADARGHLAEPSLGIVFHF